ncbi:ShlB/FhaC/HecB family hemolysin secretion/activation protein [Pseudomonas gingeri NCPPB 3146 = LMG 5327]|uniref:ShlB/FhaC/HecB family hemolysin secretion/activation protein n=2 Tax=Pseudomonas gingeri TaxID=117681 RepID=A0A7Y7Y5B3_9PSED|nr:POTRA domain-containing protein [Pseudomonas gingeri]NVZ24918.1 ShlB/FhaC/HecB family hemolysin secretion/activation protein [Pseudomonas gingeri]NWC17974.1 ShlB/FhaC/HecB family hemolysin secretion/activation protein [Pseudomonas gingeri]NWE49721.1 ShlB/FhaC/HecB family hemolysin secretion/activation protein [Pseudomonas gingeri]NWE67505.1 ShlB/FhaC/HecB family hemolysin secretion/activation protein [Pseudomonas gingeri]PNQ89373.1 ShlB/FhaC/HecB family hemolysin secretion/activation protei
MRVFALFSLCALCSSVYADTLPSFLNSNDTVRTLPTPNLPADAYRPQAISPQLPQPGASQGQALLMGTRVTIRKLQIEGGTIYPLQELGALYQPLMGHETTLADLIEATRGITRRYQEDGYLLSYAFLPPQDFSQGLVRVVLVEGYIRDYQLQGDIGAVSGLLDKLVAKLKAERPLTRKTFERYTTLMSRIPGVALQAQVPPPGTTDGATSLIAIASRKPFTTSLNTVDSSRDSLQALLGASSNAWTSMGEQLSVSGLFPPGKDKEHYYRVDYSQFLNAEGTQLSLYGSHYRSDPGSNLILDNNLELEPHRQNDRFSIGVSHPLIAASNEWLSLGGRLYGVNDKTRYQVVGQPLKVEEKTDLRALAFEGDWRKSDAERLRILSAGVYQGINGMGANTNNALYDLDFFRLRLSGVQSDKFFEHWQGVISAALYWSGDNLPDSERAVFGGQNFGRGYPDDQGNGDKGWGVAYELNYSFSRDGAWVKVLQPYVVLDRARAWFNDAPIKASDMSSAALGFRFGDGRYYNIALEAAKPMSDMALDTFNRRPRYTLSFSYQL